MLFCHCLLKGPLKTIENFFIQARISIKLLGFSMDKEQFFFQHRAGLMDLIKNTMKIDDFLMLVFVLVGLGFEIYEVLNKIAINKAYFHFRIISIMIVRYTESC
jgi:hypothetical protein